MSKIRIKTSRIHVDMLRNVVESMQKSFRRIRETCENRSTDSFCTNEIENILQSANYIKNSLKIEDVPADLFKKVMESKDYAGLYRSIVEEMEGEAKRIEEKKMKYREFCGL
ncbi:hypothetical protein ECANGB1_2089 [Enterospora canceri]|uniref:Uncharacterized protein n=1 Tax=Enterospora canceri TaxID=1081671 RepID=A0A1Y1S8W5_9MICR|nr:hypothetical protein ECANGB1_2089 [Enterospora canceri]